MATLRFHPPPERAGGSESHGSTPQKSRWEVYEAYVRRWEEWRRQLGALLRERQELDDMARSLIAAATSAGPGAGGPAETMPPLPQLLESYERQLICMAMSASCGNQREAAAALGVLPTTLNEKLKRLGLRVATQQPKH